MGQKDLLTSNQLKRGDTLFFEYIAKESYKSLFSVVKLILVLSHGQARVERGFSVNKEVEVENLKEHTLVAHCL